MRGDPLIVVRARNGDLQGVLDEYARDPRQLEASGKWTEVQEKHGYDKQWTWNTDTALIAACRMGHLDIVNFLLSKGANVFASSCLSEDVHETALGIATKNNHKEIGALLRERIDLEKAVKAAREAEQEAIRKAELEISNLKKVKKEEEVRNNLWKSATVPPSLLTLCCDRMHQVCPSGAWMKAVPIGGKLMHSILQWKEHHATTDPHRTAEKLYANALDNIKMKKENEAEYSIRASQTGQTGAGWLIHALHTELSAVENCVPYWTDYRILRDYIGYQNRNEQCTHEKRTMFEKWLEQGREVSTLPSYSSLPSVPSLSFSPSPFPHLLIHSPTLLYCLVTSSSTRCTHDTIPFLLLLFCHILIVVGNRTLLNSLTMIIFIPNTHTGTLPILPVMRSGGVRGSSSDPSHRSRLATSLQRGYGITGTDRFRNAAKMEPRGGRWGRWWCVSYPTSELCVTRSGVISSNSTDQERSLITHQ